MCVLARHSARHLSIKIRTAKRICCHTARLLCSLWLKSWRGREYINFRKQRTWCLWAWGFLLFACLIYFSVIHSYLFSGSFCRHDEIIFLNDFPYFFSISLSCTPVSKDGGSFCSVSIKTWNNYCYWQWDFPWALLETDLGENVC